MKLVHLKCINTIYQALASNARITLLEAMEKVKTCKSSYLATVD